MFLDEYSLRLIAGPHKAPCAFNYLLIDTACDVMRLLTIDNVEYLYITLSVFVKYSRIRDASFQLGWLQSPECLR
jgi:hypothetical protein